ncbi:MAG: energy-coupled thiamine transporter ThiT [Clostridiales bacterium]|jgi:thiamine transporter|nr:energy-coupled thiamine transporter ThiT [Clostridiales bacterium]
MRNTKVLTASAICVALALVLSMIDLFTMPQGGSVSPCSMFFIALAGFWFGPAVGIASGVALGLLKLLFGAYVVHPAQLILEYPLAFGLLGCSGFFRNMKFGLQTGYTVGVLLRFLMHLIAGVIFFAEYAPPGQPVWVYSSVYNFSYIWPEALFTLIVVSIPAFGDAIKRVGKNLRA